MFTNPEITFFVLRNFKDYISYFFAFFFRKLYVVTGSIFYTHNIFLNIILKTIGAIKVNSKYNFNFIEESANLINNDKTIYIKHLLLMSQELPTIYL